MWLLTNVAESLDSDLDGGLDAVGRHDIDLGSTLALGSNLAVDVHGGNLGVISPITDIGVGLHPLLCVLLGGGVTNLRSLADSQRHGGLSHGNLSGVGVFVLGSRGVQLLARTQIDLLALHVAISLNIDLVALGHIQLLAVQSVESQSGGRSNLHGLCGVLLTAYSDEHIIALCASNSSPFEGQTVALGTALNALIDLAGLLDLVLLNGEGLLHRVSILALAPDGNSSLASLNVTLLLFRHI